jgi:ParB family chromosome partitioning protein
MNYSHGIGRRWPCRTFKLHNRGTNGVVTIRVGLSYYERARIVAQSVDRNVFRSDRVALAQLFTAVSRSKRSKIGQFVTLVRQLDQGLKHPADIT